MKGNNYNSLTRSCGQNFGLGSASGASTRFNNQYLTLLTSRTLILPEIPLIGPWVTRLIVSSKNLYFDPARVSDLLQAKPLLESLFAGGEHG